MDGAYEPFIYQWKRDGIDLVDDATISGANTDTLTFTGALTADSDSDFYVGVTDTNNNEVVSRSALLTVGDFDPPLVHTLPTSHAQSLIRAARAVVVGQVNPNGLPANVEVFWGTSANTLNRTTAASPSVAPNTATTTRIGMLVIGGETHTVVQNGVLAPQISVPTEIPAGIVSGDYHLVIPTVNPPVTFNTTPTETPLASASPH